MTIQQAIEKALEGGWQTVYLERNVVSLKQNKYHLEIIGTWIKFVWENEDLKDGLWEHYYFEQLVLDPQFWQCLGKAMGWREQTCAKCNGYVFGRKYKRQNLETNSKGKPYSCHSGYEFIPEYLYHWHRMIDYLSEGKSIEDYFKTL